MNVRDICNKECSKTPQIFASLNTYPCTAFVCAMVPTYEHRHKGKEETDVLHLIKRRKAKRTGHIFILKRYQKKKRRDDKEALVSRYWMALRKTDGTGILRRKPWLALFSVRRPDSHPYRTENTSVAQIQ